MERPVGVTRLRQGLSVFVGLGVILTLVVVMASILGGGSGGYSPPSEEEKEGLVEVEMIASSPKLDVPSGLRDPDDDRHPAPLVPLEEIRSGGPPPDGIAPIDHPLFQPARDVDWLDRAEPVVVLEVAGSEGREVRAYPVRILTWHELVNDTVAGEPVTVSYCPLCNSAVGYERTIADGSILDFGTSGSLYRSSLVMYDRQTESLWTHFDGRAVVGQLTGERLTLLPMITVAWADFVSGNPDALVLSEVTGYQRDYGNNPYPGYDDPSERPFLYEGPIDDRLRAKERVAVARLGTSSVTVVWDELAEAGVHETELAGRPIVFVHVGGAVSALDAGRVAEGRDVGAVGVYLLDRALGPVEPTDEGLRTSDGTTWNVLGEATGGPLAGERLAPVEHLDTFWFAVAAFDPDTRIEHP